LTAGTELLVWRQEGYFTEKLLFAPGFAESWPQWKDVDQKHWCLYDRLVYLQARAQAEHAE